MSSKGNYSRHFIILQEDEKGYSIGNDKFPTGYAKIEKKSDKCKISYYVQNLKNLEAPYYMVLICNEREEKKIINLGELKLDQYGRCDISNDYDARNIANCKITINKIKGAAIVRFVDSKMSTILSGFVNGNELEGWKAYPVETTKIEEENIVETFIEEKKVVEDEESRTSREKKEDVPVFDEYEKSIEESKKIQNDDDESDEEDSQSSEEIEDESEEIEETKESEDNDHLDMDMDMDRCSKDNYPKGKMGKFFLEVVEGFEEVKDFNPKLGKCKWYKIKESDLSDSAKMKDYNKYTVAYYPMLGYYSYINKYKHYLLGYKCNKEGYLKYIIYAIPGMKKRSDRPFDGKTGFVTWVPIDNGDDSKMGYWLMFYDFKNSCVVIPVK
ncbi:hypothetical protein [Clostridium grantii]|uniref:DUF7922 domain-containing protein n=1 Tax=Clostridium grantii DSM 8605 TaxID=1121316 RepID=A0A1M5XU72_9CLOT|nr:hypothetical protein [Clostridium grantii]SHI03350.1 hypothetical protein SAMN02745207_03940 [Clostridium grantii DSM 8605]